MSKRLEDFLEQLKDKAPHIVKKNKGALVGAALGYLLTDSKQAQSVLLGLIAGAIVVDNKQDNDNE